MTNASATNVGRQCAVRLVSTWGKRTVGLVMEKFSSKRSVSVARDQSGCIDTRQNNLYAVHACVCSVAAHDAKLA